MNQRLINALLVLVAGYIVLFIILGNLLLLNYTTLSQTFGYAAFILFLIAFIFFFLTRKSENSGKTEAEFSPFVDGKHKQINFWVINIFASAILIFIAERDLIFSNSIISAFNPNLLEIRASLTPFSLLTGYAGNSQGFIVQSFFMNWESYLPISPVLYDKIALLSELFFYYFIAAAVSRTFYRAMGVRSIPEPVVAVMFSSFFLFNFIYRSEGFSSFIIGPLMIAYVVLKIYEAIKTDSFGKADALRIGVAISFAIFGDPRSLTYFVLILIGSAIGVILKYRRGIVRFAKFSASTFAIVLPMFAVMYLMTSFFPGFVANAGRSGDYATIASFSSGTKPMFIWDFLANWWSDFVAATPSIVSVPRSLIYSLPTIYSGQALIVYAPSSFNFIWLLSLGLLSILAVLSLFLLRNDRSNQRFYFLYIPFFILFALTLGTNIRSTLFVDFVALLSTLPVIGSFWAVTVSTPQFIDQYMSAFLIIFALYSIVRISDMIEYRSSMDERQDHRQGYQFSLKKLRPYWKYSFVFAVLLIFLFSNWQFFDQNYALGQEVSGLPGNSVSLTSAFAPITPPRGLLDAYNSLYNPNNLTYAVYANGGGFLTWNKESASFSFATPGIPPNTMFSTLLGQAVSLNMSYIIPSLMYNYGIKYVFFDKTQISPDWGLYDVLASSGLKIVSNSQDFTIFEDVNASEIHASSIPVSLNGYSPLSDIEFMSMFNSIGLTPTIVNAGDGEISFSSNGSVLSGVNGIYYNQSIIASYFPTFSYDGFAGSYSGTSNSDIFSIGDGWNITRYNGGYYVNYTVTNGSLRIQKYDDRFGSFPQSLFYIYYANGSIPIPAGDSVLFHYNFTYSSTNTSGSIQFSAMGNTRNLQAGANNRTISGTYVESESPYFSFGWALGGGYNGSLTLSHVNFSYTFLKNDMLNTSSFSNSVQAVPSTNYTVLYQGTNRNMRPYTGMKQFESGSDGHLDYNISGFDYLGSVAIFPSSLLLNYSAGAMTIETSDYGSSITGTYIGTDRYITVSYSADYKWKTSKNLKYETTNALGQEIYLLSGDGSFHLSISDAGFYRIMDWSTAVVENIILPVLLFTPVLSYIRLKKRAK